MYILAMHENTHQRGGDGGYWWPIMGGNQEAWSSATVRAQEREVPGMESLGPRYKYKHYQQQHRWQLEYEGVAPVWGCEE